MVIQKKMRRELKGELVTIKGNVLLLKLSFSSFEASIDIDDIEIITIIKETKFCAAPSGREYICVFPYLLFLYADFHHTPSF